jgi:hypothetical protein
MLITQELVFKRALRWTQLQQWMRKWMEISVLVSDYVGDGVSQTLEDPREAVVSVWAPAACSKWAVALVRGRTARCWEE